MWRSRKRTAKIAKAASPVISDLMKAKSGVPTGAAAAPVGPKVSRMTAPNTSEINGLVVGIVGAKLAPIEGGDGQDVLTLNLRITNNSEKPIKYAGWSLPDIKPKLRDVHGNFYRRISIDTAAVEKTINPGDTITDRLLFEKTPGFADLTLDLPIAETEQQYEFKITRSFIERGGASPTDPPAR